MLGDTAYARTTSTGQIDIIAANAKVKESNNELFIFRRRRMARNLAMG